jgi:hypothetical protein
MEALAASSMPGSVHMNLGSSGGASCASPCRLWIQQTTVPSRRLAQAMCSPTVTCTAPSTRGVSVGAPSRAAPRTLRPQHATRPVVSAAQVTPPPEAIPVALVSPGTSTGGRPPSRPSAARGPQQSTRPPRRIAHTDEPSSATWTTSLAPESATGPVRAWSLPPIENPRPQQVTLPPRRTAQADCPLPASCTTSLMPAMGAPGCARGRPVPSPSSSQVLKPQQVTTPPARRAQVESSPATTSSTSSTPGSSKGAARGPCEGLSTASCPLVLKPRHITSPVPRRTHSCDAPTRTSAKFPRGSRGSGVEVLQHTTSPLRRRAHARSSPTESATASVNPATGASASRCAGSSRSRSPDTPSDGSSAAQHTTLPSSRIAHARRVPTAITLARSPEGPPASPPTSSLRSVVLSPRQRTPPSLRSAHTRLAPIATWAVPERSASSSLCHVSPSC